MILYVILAIVAAGLLAYAIVNYIPRKIHWLVSILLLAAAAFLAFKIYDGIMKPIKFNKDKKVRYSKVIENLKMIRDAELAHKTVTGNFTDKGENLIKFIDTAKFAVTQTRNVPKTIKLGGGITKVIEEKVVDTIGYEPVKANFAGRNYTQMLKVPGTDAFFDIKIDKVEKVNGLMAPVFEAKINKAVVLAGMDKDLVRQEKEAIASDEVKGEYISVGSLEDVSDGGNWPPFYDKTDKQN